jgi:hypothetical protein
MQVEASQPGRAVLPLAPDGAGVPMGFHLDRVEENAPTDFDEWDHVVHLLVSYPAKAGAAAFCK